MKKEKRAKAWLQNIEEAKVLTEKQKLQVCENVSKKFNAIWVCSMLVILGIVMALDKFSGGFRASQGAVSIGVLIAMIAIIFVLLKLRNFLIKKEIKDGNYKRVE